MSSRYRTSKNGDEKRLASYLLPVSLVKAIQQEALDRDCWPARIVEEMARHRYRKAKRSQSKVKSAVSV